MRANSVIGRYISLLTKAFMLLKGEEEIGKGQMQVTRSYSTIEKERNKARTLRKKGQSTSALMSIEHSLAKQSQTVNKLKYVWLSRIKKYLNDFLGNNLATLISFNQRLMSCEG